MRVTILGSGTSTGVPMIACGCRVCTSSDPRDKRQRVSALLETELTTILIDTSADFRAQMLSQKVRKLDAVLYTHYHNDHISGFDDLRAFQFLKLPVPTCYANQETFDVIKNSFSYAFGQAKQYGGGIPNIPFEIIDESPFRIGELLIEPIPADHGAIITFGFRVGKFAYLTDCNRISPPSKEKLRNLDTLILDGLRYEPHPTHFSVDQAVAIAKELKPRITYLTHMNHDVLHAECEARLPENIRLGFDGLNFQI
ncbi:MAG: MBL fold metallo-hydrolase [Ignavibacteriota bacterium]